MVCELLPKEPTAPAEARRLLERFDGALPPHRLDDARLLVSEVVSNAVEHVADPGQIEVRLSLEGTRLRVEVVDPGSGFVPRERDPEDHRGWGLQFVQTLSDDWGTAASDGNRVWFELTA